MALSNKQLKQMFYQPLKDLRAIITKYDNGDKNPSDSFNTGDGICDNIYTLYVTDTDNHVIDVTNIHIVFERAIVSVNWAHYSGNANYPISADNIRDFSVDVACPVKAFTFNDNVWLGEYGRRRRELLDLCIKFLGGNNG